jgi:hypothetical protein
MKNSAVLSVVLLFNGVVLAASLKDYQFISPMPGSDFNTRESSIIIREGSIMDPTCVNNSEAILVTGSKSGKVPGEIVLSSDKRTVIFKPAYKFEPDETVTVQISNRLLRSNGSALPSAEFSFKIAPFAETLNPYDYINTIAPDFGVGKNSLTKVVVDTLPTNYPNVTVNTYDTTKVGDGYIFMSIFSTVSGVGYYIMMLNNDGTPFYYKEFKNHAYDFKIQPNGLMSYGRTLQDHPYGGGGDVIWMIMDNSFTEVDSVQMGNGYLAECHDFRILPNGHYLLFGYYLVPFDMSQVVAGGYPNALVTGGVIQELDQDKNVIFQWRTWDHYDLKTFPYDPALATQSIVDEFHFNAIEFDNDNNIIISTPTWSKKINRQTGDIMWHIGGQENQFSFVNIDSVTGVDYIAGHTFYRIQNGNILLFDNGNFSPPKTAMAHEFSLDEVNKRAELKWSYIPQSFVLAMSMGSTQRLPNGNTAIGWGSGRIAGNLGPAFTEVDEAGNVVYELSFAKSGVSSYRAYRFPFVNGAPSAVVLRHDLSPGNIYNFNDSPNANTGISVQVNSYEGSGYNNLIATKYNYASSKPQFFGKAPIANPGRIVISKNSITSLDIDVIFDLNVWNVVNPENTSIYYREFEGNGLFLKLPTDYNPVTKTLTANVKGVGEFILARPDLESLALTPLPNAPQDSSTANYQLPVTITWSPVGYAEKYHFQLSSDDNFSNLLADVNYLTNAFYTINTLEKDAHYYWRVKASNDGAESPWTATQMFVAVAPFITVTKPNGGEQWQRGLSYFIQWDDNLAEDVVIELYKGDSLSSTIATTSNLGAYKWQISTRLETGSDYSIKVKSKTDNALFDLSDNKFAVIDTTSTFVENESSVVKDYALYQNYPNPFNPTTTISFHIPSKGIIDLSVFNLLGEKVVTLLNDEEDVGDHSIKFDAKSLPSGIYFYRLKSGSHTIVKKMMLTK